MQATYRVINREIGGTNGSSIDEWTKRDIKFRLAELGGKGQPCSRALDDPATAGTRNVAAVADADEYAMRDYPVSGVLSFAAARAYPFIAHMEKGRRKKKKPGKKGIPDGYFSCRAVIDITADRVGKMRSVGAYFLVCTLVLPRQPGQSFLLPRERRREEGE